MKKRKMQVGPSAAGAMDEKAKKVAAWRKEVAAKTAQPDPALDKAVADAKNTRAAKAAVLSDACPTGAWNSRRGAAASPSAF